MASSRQPTPAPSQTPSVPSTVSRILGRSRPSPASSSSTARPAGSSRASSRAATEPYRSSPRLPVHPQRQRLSLRPPSRPTSSAAPSHGREDGEVEQLQEDASQQGSDALNEIIMAIDVKDNGIRGCNIGCAYYIAADESLYLLEDVPMTPVDLVETLLLHANPTTVLIPSRAPESLADLLGRGAQSIDGNRGDLQGAYVLRNMNSADFRYEPAKDKLLSLDLAMPGPQTMLYTSVVDDAKIEGDDYGGPEGSRQGRLIRLGTSINLDSRLTVGCAGALLGDIERRRTAQYLPNDPDALVLFRIRSVEMFSLFNSMFVNAETLASLQILQSEYHPNSHQQGPSSSGAKESLSLYGLFHHLASTPQGKLKLRQIFLRPSIDIGFINERQRVIGFFLHPGNTEALVGLSKDLRKIKNLKSTMTYLRKGIDSPGRQMSIASNVWATLQKFAAFSLQIRESLRALPGSEKIDTIRKVIEVTEPLPIHQVGELITQTVDFEQSMERGRTAVKQGVDAELDELKRRYDGMDHFLTGVIAKLQNGLPEWARKYVKNCIFFPQLGFLTAVTLNPETGKGNYDGEGLDDVWERMFVAEECVYYKNRQMKEMDDEFGDAYCMIIDREIEIIHDLTVAVLEREEIMISTSEVLGDLDSLLALATGCGQYHWVAPKMTDENVIDIEGGRHPLQELVVRSFVANDCYMLGGPGDLLKDEAHEGEAHEGEAHEGEAHEVLQYEPGDHIRHEPDSPSEAVGDPDECPSTLVLTGPNHSGKSVYLKQVALIVYLAHIGCFVPAERAQIGLTDRILTRVATRESVGRNESAFAIDLRQVAFAMNFATHRSLVLIDEFGKGTNSEDGVGLMTATLQHFTCLGPSRPKVLAATHFHEIFEGGFLQESPQLGLAHMDIRLDYDAPSLEDQVTYLYQLVPGRSISSFGSRCAAMNGIDQAIVDRAESIMLQMVRNEDLEVVCSKLSEAETQKLKRAEAVARAFLQEDFEPPPPLSAGRAEVASWYRKKLEVVLAAGNPVSDEDTTMS
ncbi:muts domain V-domain-containing protein [Xylariaceae sp. FL0804]|nr:muts domain V-domain-containing protein [Xylariaceae sp. FL0804]